MHLITAFPLLLLGSFILSTNLGSRYGGENAFSGAGVPAKTYNRLQPSGFYQIAKR